MLLFFVCFVFCRFVVVVGGGGLWDLFSCLYLGVLACFSTEGLEPFYKKREQRGRICWNDRWCAALTSAYSHLTV